ncbi:MAG: hypothetical protein ACTSRD_04525 [Promethearchaeota archaeon]
MSRFSAFFGPRYRTGRGYGRGMGGGYGRGMGPGRRFASPNCDFYPDRPRGWWAIPQYQAPPQEAVWDTNTGDPKNIEAIDYEILMIEKQMEEMKKEIEQLKSIKNK